MRARIIGVKAQMLDFNHFFGVNLGERLFSMTDNLSRTLQQTRMSAVQGQRLAEMTKQTIQKMRTDDDFEDFSRLVKKRQIPCKPKFPSQAYQEDEKLQSALKLEMEILTSRQLKANITRFNTSKQSILL